MDAIVTEKTKLYSFVKFERDGVIGEKEMINNEFFRFHFQFKNDHGLVICEKEKYLQLLEFFKVVINEEKNTK